MAPLRNVPGGDDDDAALLRGGALVDGGLDGFGVEVSPRPTAPNLVMRYCLVRCAGFRVALRGGRGNLGRSQCSSTLRTQPSGSQFSSSLMPPFSWADDCCRLRPPSGESLIRKPPPQRKRHALRASCKTKTEKPVGLSVPVSCSSLPAQLASIGFCQLVICCHVLGS